MSDDRYDPIYDNEPEDDMEELCEDDEEGEE